MSGSVSELIIKISGDVKEFKGSLDDVVSSTEDFNLSLGAIAGIAAAAFAVVSGAIYESLDAYKEAEEAGKRLTLSLQNQGLYSDLLMQSYRGQAEELQKLTGVDDDAIIKGQAQLQSMIGRVKITKEMSEAALNLGAALGGDATQGFEILGRAMEGNTRGLKQLGIEIDDNLTKEERTEQILRKVTTAYGGLAESQNQGLGSIKGLKSALGDLAEDLGSVFAPSVSGATKLLTEFFQNLHQQNVKNNDPFSQIDEKIKNTIVSIESLKMNSEHSLDGLDANAHTQMLKEASRQLDILKIQRDDMMKSSRGSREAQDPEKEKAAIRVQATRDAQQARERESLLAHNRMIREQIEDHTKQVDDLYKEEAETTAAIADDKNKFVRGALQEHLAEIKKMREEALIEETEKQATVNQEYLDMQEEFGALAEGQRQEFEQKDLAAAASLRMTENEAKRQFFQQELKERIKNNNTFLMEQQKYGTAYALISKVMHSEIYQGSKQAFGELAQLQSSSNSTLKSIGKAAAIANIIIKTAESAMAIYAGFSTIPIIGPVLGVAGAAAAVAFGAEQVGRVTAAAQGGLISGGIPGMDSVPLLAQQGELVAPTKNFDEVVGSVAAKRMAEDQGYAPGGAGNMVITIAMDGKEAERVLTARQTEARSLGLYSGS